METREEGAEKREQRGERRPENGERTALTVPNAVSPHPAHFLSSFLVRQCSPSLLSAPAIPI